MAGDRAGGPAGRRPQPPAREQLLARAGKRYWTERYTTRGGRTRSADEVGIVCRTQSAAQRALAAVTQAGQKLTLTLHPTKTRIVEMQYEGGELLGFHCQRSERGRVGDGGPAWGRAREP
jgi:RNA-directed DNA polymerase